MARLGHSTFVGWCSDESNTNPSNPSEPLVLWCIYDFQTPPLPKEGEILGAIRLEAIAGSLDAIALGVEAIASRMEGIAIRRSTFLRWDSAFP